MGRVQHAPSGCKNTSMCDRGSHSWVRAHLTSTACMCHNPVQLPLPTGDTTTGAWQNQNRKSWGKIFLSVLLSVCKWSPRPFKVFHWHSRQKGDTSFFPSWLTLHTWHQNRRRCLLLTVIRGRSAKVALLCAVRGAVLESMTNCACSPAEHKYYRMHHFAGLNPAAHTTRVFFGRVVRFLGKTRQTLSEWLIGCWFRINPTGTTASTAQCTAMSASKATD